MIFSIGWPNKYRLVVPGRKYVLRVRVEGLNLKKFFDILSFSKRSTWISWPGFQETLWTVLRSSLVILETRRARKEERKLAQQFGLQSTAVLGMSLTVKVCRSVTRPWSSLQPHWMCLVPTRKLWLHHFNNLNLLKFLFCFSVSMILLVFSSRNFSGLRGSSSLTLKHVDWELFEIWIKLKLTFYLIGKRPSPLRRRQRPDLSWS